MNNLDTPEGLFCYQMLQKAVKFDEEWFDWSEDKIKQYIEANSGNNFILVMYMYYELGKDEKWFKRQIKELEGEKKQFLNY